MCVCCIYMCVCVYIYIYICMYMRGTVQLVRVYYSVQLVSADMALGLSDSGNGKWTLVCTGTKVG